MCVIKASLAGLIAGSGGYTRGDEIIIPMRDDKERRLAADFKAHVGKCTEVDGYEYTEHRHGERPTLKVRVTLKPGMHMPLTEPYPSPAA